MKEVQLSSIRYWSESDRPREKLILHGKETLSNAELIAILIGSGAKETSAVDMARLILKSCQDNLIELGKLNIQEFLKFKGMGEAKSLSIIAALELGKRRQHSTAIERPKINNSKDAFDILSYNMMDLRKEVFRIILLNRNNRVIKTVEISNGGIAGTVVDPKVIFKSAIDHESSSIILSHNHPSGNLQPSQADLKITNQVKESGKLLDVKVLDHLIISERGYFSFADEGIL